MIKTYSLFYEKNFVNKNKVAFNKNTRLKIECAIVVGGVPIYLNTSYVGGIFTVYK